MMFRQVWLATYDKLNGMVNWWSTRYQLTIMADQICMAACEQLICMVRLTTIFYDQHLARVTTSDRLVNMGDQIWSSVNIADPMLLADTDKHGWQSGISFTDNTWSAEEYGLPHVISSQAWLTTWDPLKRIADNIRSADEYGLLHVISWQSWLIVWDQLESINADIWSAKEYGLPHVISWQAWLTTCDQLTGMADYMGSADEYGFPHVISWQTGWQRDQLYS
jgi:hypothetical protein